MNELIICNLTRLLPVTTTASYQATALLLHALNWLYVDLFVAKILSIVTGGLFLEV